VLAAIVGVTMVAMWAWVFAYHLGGSWRDSQPGQLDDTVFATTAEPRCAAAMAELAALPQAWETPTPTERADAVDMSVVVLERMVGDLATMPAGSDETAVGEWLADWQNYIDDRADYAARLRDDPEARFYVTQSDRDNRQITLAIDRLAETNAMPSCATPGDLS